MQRELQEAGEAGIKFLGVTVSKTRFGGRDRCCQLHSRRSTGIMRLHLACVVSLVALTNVTLVGQTGFPADNTSYLVPEHKNA